eukprot:gene30199-37370_t
MRLLTLNIDTALFQETVQLEILKKQHIEAREALGLCHNGNGWKTEAYLSIIDSTSLPVSVSKLPKLLSQWIICSDQPDTINPQYLQQLLHDIQNNANTPSKNNKPLRQSYSEGLYDLSDDEQDDKQKRGRAAADEEQDYEEEFIVIKSSNNNNSDKNNKNSSNRPGVVHSNGEKIDQIDFKTFCVLCDRIIILNESQ